MRVKCVDEVINLDEYNYLQQLEEKDSIRLVAVKKVKCCDLTIAFNTTIAVLSDVETADSLHTALTTAWDADTGDGFFDVNAWLLGVLERQC